MSLSRSLLTRLLALAVSVAVPALANADDEMPTADASNVPALVVRAQSQAKQAHATAHADASQSQAMLDRKVEAKQEAIDGTKAKIEAERDAAAEQFAVAVAAAAAATAAVGIQPSTCVGADDTLMPAIAQATSAAGDAVRTDKRIVKAARQRLAKTTDAGATRVIQLHIASVEASPQESGGRRSRLPRGGCNYPDRGGESRCSKTSTEKLSAYPWSCCRGRGTGLRARSCRCPTLARRARRDETAVAAVGEHRARVLVERAVRSVSVVLSPPSGGTSPDTHRRSDQRWTTKISRGF